MRKLSTILLLLFCTLVAQAQIAPWTPFAVDNAVVLRVPGRPQPVPDAAHYAPGTPASQVRGYRYSDAAGTYIILRQEKPMDKMYAVDSDHEFYSTAIDQMMHDTRGTLIEEAILVNGPSTAACAHYTVPGGGPRYMGILLVHRVSYQFQYMPNKGVTKDQDAKLWAQFLKSVASIK
ncbi:hypothetical protein SAMN00120144_3138 [Hymenobacter roseosalivarius DSM 11622]|uniref:Uncharacterized protein n=1 Tax=Hymenobacter roseosalivarius DSM 11622 TaxID=645990 RepID=A0A1W1UF74_9BACT|nr:hypothetical protein [Hymenobacter roseosalivarius]SMB79434.1 hypothetical protein SAMN00120144_3138 [Hymenobacter roseosalivarius DSM 11622]